MDEDLSRLIRRLDVTGRRGRRVRIIRNTIVAAGRLRAAAGELRLPRATTTRHLGDDDGRTGEFPPLISRHVRRVSDNGARCDRVPQLAPPRIGQTARVDCPILSPLRISCRRAANRKRRRAGAVFSGLVIPRDRMNGSGLLAARTCQAKYVSSQ